MVELGWETIDVGTDSAKAVDYPEFAFSVARTVMLEKAGLGIMIDGAGIGSSMVCNKVRGIRAALCYDERTIVNSREHIESLFEAQSRGVGSIQDYLER